MVSVDSRSIVGVAGGGFHRLRNAFLKSQRWGSEGHRLVGFGLKGGLGDMLLKVTGISWLEFFEGETRGRLETLTLLKGFVPRLHDLLGQYELLRDFDSMVLEGLEAGIAFLICRVVFGYEDGPPNLPVMGKLGHVL